MGDSQKLIGGDSSRKARLTNLLLVLLLLPTALLILCSTPAAASVEQGKLYLILCNSYLAPTWPTDSNFGAIQWNLDCGISSGQSKEIIRRWIIWLILMMKKLKIGGVKKVGGWLIWLVSGGGAAGSALQELVSSGWITLKIPSWVAGSDPCVSNWALVQCDAPGNIVLL